MKFLHTNILELIINLFCVTIDDSYEPKLKVCRNSVSVSIYFYISYTNLIPYSCFLL